MQRINHLSVAILGIAILVSCGCRQEQKVATSGSAETETQKIESSETAKEVVPTTTVSKKNVGEKANVPATEKQAVDQQSSTPATATTNKNEAKSNKQENEKASSLEPVTVAQATQALDFSKFKKPKGAKDSYVFQTSMHYDTSADMDTALIQVADELLKRGFVEKDSQRTRMGTVTININDRPMSIFLANSWGGDLTHVTMYNHQGIDISSVPMLQASSPIDKRVDQVYYQSPIGVREGQHNLRAEIGKQGLEIARMRTGNGIAKVFEKDGVNVIVQAEAAEQMEFEYPQQGQNGKSTSVAIFNRGNVNVTKLPRPSDFEQTKQAYTTIFGSAKFFTNSGAMDAVKRAEKELLSAGWKKVDPIREGISDVQRLLMKNGTLVQIQATEFGDNRSHVDYSLSLLPFDIPGDVATRMIRVDSAAPHMFFSTTADVDTLREFYTDHLETIGWKSDQSNQIATSDRFALLYHVSYHQPVVLDIQSKGEESTWVEVRPVDLEEMAKIFRKAPPKDAVAAKVEANDEESSSDAQQMQEVASALSNVDLPDSSAQIEALARKQMEEALKNVPADQAAEIKKMMEQQLAGMFTDEESETDGSAEEMAETFAAANESEGEAKEEEEPSVPEGKIAAEDFPIPDGAQNVTRDFEMITFSVSEVKKHAKFVTEKLTALDWKTRGEQIIEDDLAMLRFQKGVGTINVSLTVDDRRDPPVHAVAHGDGIWFPESEMYGDDGAYEGGPPAGDFEDDPGFDEFEVKDFEGMPLPKGIESPIKMRSQFRSEFVTSVEGDIKTIHEFFRTSAAATDWKIQSDNLKTDDSIISMSSDRGELTVELKKFEGEIEITLAFRDPKVAKEQGFVPPAGKARLLLANIAKVETTIVINGKSYKLAPEQGAEDPKDSVRVDVAPGEYKYSIKAEGREEQSDKVKAVAGGTWGIVVLPEQGHMAERMY